ncbi:MAG: NADH-quinone oxidoreductase subunit M [Deltaproteobacteria bacterium]|nr:NADH-quinone oxidoreductase subunit M [Deltaproteobacteria bacterium]NIS77120.1 NADH-quinone oxidoreductase subunit M [Deltaproteobacteria bacterium]
MSILGIPILSLMIFLPVAGILVLFFVPKEREGLIKNFSLLVTLLVFAVSLAVLARFDGSLDVMQMVEKRSWLPGYGIQYFLGIDGISLWLVLLTTFLMPISVLASYSGIRKNIKEYMIFMLLLETGMVGVFLALDLFLFYIFWELMLIPMYFLIGVWGGERRIYAAIKFFLYTMAGSVLMLVAILALAFYNKGVTGEFTFDLLELYRLNMPAKLQLYMFGAFFLAFAFKVPMFPFHTWLPDAHVEAPTAGSVILAGVLLKMGTYGFLRFAMPLFPQATVDLVPVISVLAIIGIIYGALVAMVQKDVKKLVAYSSVSHLGFVMLGMFALNIQGIEGGIIQMINHGLSTGALFLIVGIIYERTHTRLIENFGGLSRVVPLFAAFFMVITLSSIGLPGLNGFVGEFLILLGAFKVNKTFAVLAATGVILAAVYMLWMFQRVMFGKVTREANRKIADMNLREIAYMLPIILFIVWIGVYPQPFLRKMDASVKHLIHQVESRVQVAEKDRPYHERIMARYFETDGETR